MKNHARKVDWVPRRRRLSPLTQAKMYVCIPQVWLLTGLPYLFHHYLSSVPVVACVADLDSGDAQTSPSVPEEAIHEARQFIGQPVRLGVFFFPLD